MVSQWSGA